jgi:predicted nucleotidyltransferase
MAYSLENKISKDELASFCKRNHIRKLSVFGSAVRGELLPDSDIDLLVEFEQGLTPFFDCQDGDGTWGNAQQEGRS